MEGTSLVRRLPGLVVCTFVTLLTPNCLLRFFATSPHHTAHLPHPMDLLAMLA